MEIGQWNMGGAEHQYTRSYCCFNYEEVGKFDLRRQ